MITLITTYVFFLIFLHVSSDHSSHIFGCPSSVHILSAVHGHSQCEFHVFTTNWFSSSQLLHDIRDFHNLVFQLLDTSETFKTALVAKTGYQNSGVFMTVLIFTIIITHISPLMSNFFCCQQYHQCYFPPVIQTALSSLLLIILLLLLLLILSFLVNIITIIIIISSSSNYSKSSRNYYLIWLLIWFLLNSA